MLYSSGIKHHEREQRLFSTRIIAAFILCILILLSLFARLVYLQIIAHRYYSTLSKANVITTLPIEPNRGLIYDRNGVLLAQNQASFSLTITPDKTLNLPDTISAVSKIVPLQPNDIRLFYRAMRESHPFQPVTIFNHLTEDEVAAFYVNRYRLPGVNIEADLIRHYPLQDETAHVVGYVGRINAKELAQLDTANYSASHYIGKTGIEKYYESTLHGTIGNAEAEVNANGRVVRMMKKTPPTPGNNLYLTLDSTLQAAAKNALGDTAGAVVAIQPSTGQVLAMVSNPSFDPNLFVVGLTNEQYKTLSTAPEHPLYNRTIHGLFAPGSTVKPYYALLALDQGVITPDYHIVDPGWFKIPGSNHVYHDWVADGHGIVNVVRAITVSCDTFFYGLALKLGIDRLDVVLNAFGFGASTGIDLPNEHIGIIPSPTWKLKTVHHPWYLGDTVETGIGQGFLLVTPLQLANAVATLANHGVMMKPTLLLKTITPDGKTIENASQTEKTITLQNEKAWDTVLQGMEDVITNPEGTGIQFGRTPPYTIAAKTGTAQVYGHRDEVRNDNNLPTRLKNNHLFIAYAPVDHPEIAIAVVAEHNDIAVRTGRMVLDAYFHEQKEAHAKQ